MLVQNESNLEDILLLRSRFVKQKRYWNNKLAGEFDVTAFLFGFDNRNLSRTGEEGKITISFPEELGKQAIQLSKNSDLSLYILLLTALKVLIFRCTSNRDIIVISPVNQLAVTEETMNRLVFIRDRVESNLTFKEMVLRVRQSVLEAYENQDYPVDKLLESLFPSLAPLEQRQNQTIISHISDISCSLANLHTPLHEDNDENNSEVIKTGLSFHFAREQDRLEGYVSFDRETCKESEVAQVANHLLSLLTNALADVNTKIPGISFLSDREKQQLLVDFNSNRADFSRDRTIYHLLADHAEKNPGAPAIGFEEETITYHRLDTEANQLATYLQSKGVGPDQPVGILLERSPLMVKCILAVWKAGGAYIPLDTRYPGQRIREILEDSGTKVLITQSKHIDSHFEPPGNCVIVNPEDLLGETAPAKVPVVSAVRDMNSLAYIIYTSGSTGKPKGVMVEHIGMMNHIAAKIHDIQIGKDSIIAQNSSHTFDISVWQFFAALTTGGKTIIYPDEIVFDPEQLIPQVINHRVTILEVVPSYLAVMLEILGAAPRVFPSLVFLLVTGEEVKPHLVQQWFARYPHIKMVNAYGPTEASDDITHYIMDKAPHTKNISIGKPVQNFNIYILDNHMNPCPPGVKGEIYVSGIGVGRGYLNNPELTIKSFCGGSRGAVFSKSAPLAVGDKMYKTGDLGRWLMDGTIEFFGRKDHQVKVRGFRIELGEIETQLTAHPAIKESVVMVKDTDDQILCAFLVPFAEEKPEISSLKDYLAERLPYYMVPDHFIQLENIPLTPNGKIDRKALSQIDLTVSIQKEYVAPRGEVEDTLAHLWADLLGIEKETIGIHYNFFDLGGQSLKATIMAQRIYKTFNINIPVGEIFKTPTIEGIASLISVTDWIKTQHINNVNLDQQESEEIVI